MTKQAEFIARTVAAFTGGTLVRLTLGGYRGEGDLERVRAQPALIRGEPRLACTYAFKTKATHRNLATEEIAAELERLFAAGFNTGTMRTIEADLVFEQTVRGAERLVVSPPSVTAPPSLSHDRAKEYLVDARAPYLHQLDITDRSGRVRREMNSKFRQVCKFIEIVRGLLDESPQASGLPAVVDIGSGKSYLTFALYDYLVTRFGAGVAVQGVEVRQDLVDRSAAVAAACSFAGLTFLRAAGGAVPLAAVDMVVALHACDTATDDALAQAVRRGARIVVVAPCCHRYVRQRMVVPDELRPALGHGILEARLADSLTDGLRALWLKAHGYTVKVFEFISPEHTAKNTMITAIKRGGSSGCDEAALGQIEQIKAKFGLTDFYLDTQIVTAEPRPPTR